jgi:DNA-binding IclR family transcriptional regulator
MTRTNDECVCIQRVYGDAVVRIAPFKPGNRLPLGVGPCGLALLAQFSDDEIEAYVRHFFATSVFVKRVTFLDPDRMISDAIACREKGYALTIGQAYPELFGLGIALPGEEAGSLAVCITAPVELMAERDPDDLYASMRQCIARWSAPES